MRKSRLLWWFYIGFILPFIFMPLLSHAADGDYVEEGKTIESPLEYASHPTFTGDAELVDKKYVDDTAIIGGSYTDEQAQDAVGAMLTDTDEIDFTFDDGAGTIEADIKAASIDETKLDTSVNDSLDLADSALQTETDAVFIAWDKSTGISITESQILDLGTYLTSEVDGSITNEIQDISLAGDTLSLSSDATPVDLSGYYNSLADLQGVVSNDFHNLGGTDANTTYTASGTLLNLSSTAFSVKEGTLTNGKYCIYVTGTGLVCNSESGGMTYPSGSGIPIVTSGTSWGTTIANNSANWDAAYSWGNHASAGYLTGITGESIFDLSDFPVDPNADKYLKWDDDPGILVWADAGGGGGYTNLTSFVDQTAWRVFYTNTDGDTTELALGSSGTYFKSNGPTSAPSWDTPSGAPHDAVTLSAALGSNLLGLSTQELTLDTQTANYVFAGPTSGAAAAPSFRALGATDIPTLNQSTTGSAASLSISGQTGLLTFTGLTSTNRQKTVRNAADTMLELGGSYTPTGTWNWGTASVTWPTFNQNTTGTAAGLAGQYIDWNAASGGRSIANKPTLLVIDNTPDNGGSDAAGEDWGYKIENEAMTFYGIKTFDSFPITPSSAPTTAYQVANKKYVDDNGGASVTGTSSDTYTVNNDLQDVTSKLIFGRTTGGNAEISWNGTNIGINKYTTVTVADGAVGMRLIGDTGRLRIYPYFNATYGVSLEAMLTSESSPYYVPMTFASNKFLFYSGQVLINATAAIGTEKLRVNGNEYLDGTLTVAGGQIAFPATQNASSNANTLDDYKEGMYQPTVTCASSGSFTIDSNIDNAVYTKTGNRVFVSGTIHITGESACNGQIRISLPSGLTSANPNSGYAFYWIAPVMLINHGGTVDDVIGHIAYSSDYISLSYMVDGAITEINQNEVDTDWYVSFNMQYQTVN